MKTKKSVKRLLSLFTSSAMMFTLTSALPEQRNVMAVSEVVIDINKEYQTIRGFGGINHPEWTGADLSEAQRQTAFGNGDNELGLTVLRVFVNPDRNQWYKALPTAQFATKMGATVFASPWEPPANLAESGGSNGKLHIPKSNYGAYAQHLNDFGTYMKDNNVDLYSISVQNEPDYASEWTYWSTDETTDFIANYGDRITSTRLMSPESFQYAPENASWVSDGGKKFYRKILNNSKAMENCDLFGTHMYGTARDWMDFPDLENSGKEIWMTEVYVPNSDADSANRYPEAVQVAENIHNAMVVGNMSAYTWWYIRRNYGLMTEDGKISKRGYCMAQYSKYVRPGDVRVDATEQPEDDVLVSAYKGDDNQVTIVAVNRSEKEYTQNFRIDNENISDVDRYRTSAGENIAPTLNMEFNGDNFYAQLPANSVSTFVVTLSDESVEPNEYGWYFADGFEGSTCDWNIRGAGEVLTSGRTAYVGNESLLVKDRTNAWNGASKTLGRAFEAGNEYSFSANVMYFDGDATDKFYLKLQYTDKNGDTQYSTIAEAGAIKGKWVQLANRNYKIPSDASDMQIYIETANSTSNFYIDEVIGAVAGTSIIGAGESKNIILGDINSDGVINSFDMVLARKGLADGFSDSAEKISADVDQSGDYNINDAVLIQKFILGQINQFPVAEKTVDTVAMEKIFSGVTPAGSYKKSGENNPLYTQHFGADPGVMEYNGRVYVYMTNDVVEYDANGNVTENTYGQVNKINCISSDDMVNWTDHGAINVAGSDGVAKWAGLSWAPCTAHKTINGKEKFFLYFCNGGNGICVLTADSPTGPWSDPLGHALVTRDVPNCNNIPWLFDPAVFVDSDGTGYLCFGGGVPEGKEAMPSTTRIVKLGDDMTSIVGTPSTIDAPYVFEDSGINKIGNKYYYTYCSNWKTGGNSYGLSSAGIQYMVADNPLGPYTYGGELFKNQGNFFSGMTGNNHHSIVELNNQLYLFYHSRPVEKAMGIDGNYRSPQVDKITMNGTEMNAVTGTMAGISQLKKLNPYSKVQAETMSNQSNDISVNGLGDTAVHGKKGSWISVSGADFSKGAKTLTIKASSANGAVIKVCKGDAKGEAVAYAEIPSGMSEIKVPVISSVNGSTELCFLFSGDADFDYWYFS